MPKRKIRLLRDDILAKKIRRPDVIERRKLLIWSTEDKSNRALVLDKGPGTVLLQDRRTYWNGNDFTYGRGRAVFDSNSGEPVRFMAPDPKIGDVVVLAGNWGGSEGMGQRLVVDGEEFLRIPIWMCLAVDLDLTQWVKENGLPDDKDPDDWRAITVEGLGGNA